MQAELRALLTAEHTPIESLKPDKEAFSYWLRALIGPVGAPGEESFDFEVCSPAWLMLELEGRPFLEGNAMLIVQHFDPQVIESAVRRRITQASGDSWAAIARNLARWSRWEFEDYHP